MRRIKENRIFRLKSLRMVITLLVLACMLLGSVSVSAKETGKNDQVLLGGELFGTRIDVKGVLVVGLASVVSENGERYPARDAGICPKDIITAVDGVKISGANELVRIIEESKGRELSVTLEREGKEMILSMSGVVGKDGKCKGGLWVRDSIAGIGTVTFIDPETGNFAGLGHGICDPDTGVLVPVEKGTVYGVILGDVRKGSEGKPGELRGRLDGVIMGEVTQNEQSGIYGRLSEMPKDPHVIKTARKSEVKPGKVSVVSSVDGQVREYEAEIEKIISNEGETKNFLIRITDERLIKMTGGIVQGMSGSPIIQNGKLVGAVTHVLIDDPTTGYGIFAENMLANIAKALEK